MAPESPAIAVWKVPPTDGGGPQATPLPPCAENVISYVWPQSARPSIFTSATLAFGENWNSKVRPDTPSPDTATVAGAVPSLKTIEIESGTKHAGGGAVVEVVVVDDVTVVAVFT